MIYKIVTNLDSAQLKTLDDNYARHIYSFLNKEEKDEIQNWLKDQRYSLADVINYLYITISQRRRMNPRLIKAVEKYNNSNILKVIKFNNTNKNNNIYVSFNNENYNEIIVISDKSPDYTFDNMGSVEKWIQQVPFREELDSEYNNEVSYKDAIKIDNNVVIKDNFNIKKLWRKIIRYMYTKKNKNIRNQFNKNKNKDRFRKNYIRDLRKNNG